MPALKILLSPFNLLFLIIISGLAIGRIEIRRITLGIAGILFSGMLIGFIAQLILSKIYIENFSEIRNSMEIFSSLGTSLFVSVIGLQTGVSVKKSSEGAFISFIIGSLMSISGILVMLLISATDKTMPYPFMLGILCGALTSTPGLSSICESDCIGNELSVLGYGSSYLPGVIFAVFFSGSERRNIAEKNSETILSQNTNSRIHTEIMLIGIAALCGNILGSIRLSLFDVSLGKTACVLFSGLISGYFIKSDTKNSRNFTQTMDTVRNLGLSLFFAGTGFLTGVQAVKPNVRAVIYGVLISLSAIMCGRFLSGFFSARYNLHAGFIIAGGMTSSPAYGTICNRADRRSASHFSFAYFGALISLIIILQIIAR